MEIDREELLRQKALIEDQLRWIESKLAQTSKGDKPVPAPETISPTATPASPATPATPLPVARANLPIVTETLTRDSAVSPSVEEAATTFEQEFAGKSDPGTVTPLQKIGCALIAIAICVGVLAAMFLLPYIIYD